MSILRYPGICEHCEASLICASGNWSSIRHTRCRHCGAKVMVFHAPDDIRKTTVVSITQECPLPFSGNYALCAGTECMRKYYNEYRDGQANSYKKHTKKTRQSGKNTLPGSPRPKKKSSK